MPRITHDFIITNDTNIGKINETYHLLANKLYLDTDYMYIYTMSYLDHIEGLYPNDFVFSNDKINKAVLTHNELIDKIKYNFSQENMLKYFGSKMDLETNLLRKVYNNMSKYFLILFYKKIHKMINKEDIDIHNCVIAECMHIIRASVKKYARLRISPHTPSKFSKRSLNARNAQKYGCKHVLHEYEYCPSFSQLLNGYTDGNGVWRNPKTCDKIIESTLTTNDGYTFLSKIKIPTLRHEKSYSSIFHFGNKPLRTKSKTRKRMQYTPSYGHTKLKINTETLYNMNEM